MAKTKKERIEELLKLTRLELNEKAIELGFTAEEVEAMANKEEVAEAIYQDETEEMNETNEVDENDENDETEEKEYKILGPAALTNIRNIDNNEIVRTIKKGSKIKGVKVEDKIIINDKYYVKSEFAEEVK